MSRVVRVRPAVGDRRVRSVHLTKVRGLTGLLAVFVAAAALVVSAWTSGSLGSRGSDWESWPPPARTWHGRCDKVASPHGSDSNPGTRAQPYFTVQALADALAPGQTGCLRGGTYHRSDDAFGLSVRRSGRRGAPITIQSYPRERARLYGITQVERGANWVVLADLAFDGDGSQNTIKLYSSDVTVENSDITNHRRGQSCLLLGSAEEGEAVRPLIRGNRLHDCGSHENGNKDHAIYASNTVNGRIVDNLITNSSAYAIQFYPDADGTRFERNVVDGGGSIRGGVLLGGDDENASSGNLVAHNVIAFAATYGVTSDWERARGTGNVVRDNCLWHAQEANLDHAVGFRTHGNLIANPKFRDRAHGDYRMPSHNRCRRVLR